MCSRACPLFSLTPKLNFSHTSPYSIYTSLTSSRTQKQKNVTLFREFAPHQGRTSPNSEKLHQFSLKLHLVSNNVTSDSISHTRQVFIYTTHKKFAPTSIRAKHLHFKTAPYQSLQPHNNPGNPLTINLKSLVPMPQ